jgi:hypothetical protein
MPQNRYADPATAFSKPKESDRMDFRAASRCILLVLFACAVSCLGVDPVLEPASAHQEPRDVVHGCLVQFDDNGAWCWYQDERAVVDTKTGTLIVGSVGNAAGTGGRPRNGSLDAVNFNLETRRASKFELKNAFTSYGGGDDHNSPAFLLLPDGSYAAVYAGHNNDYFSYYRIFANGAWSPEYWFDWKSAPGGADFPTTYSNLFYMSAERRVYNISRGHARSPNFSVSDDLGRNWKYGGLLTSPERSIGYVNGYFKYSGNGKDRIDFIGTEHHPRDYHTSIYHGYLKSGKTFDSFGRELDANVFDRQAPTPAEFTPVFKSGTVVNGVTMTRCWTIDLQTYEDGTVAAFFEARANDDESDHRFFYARFDGKAWIPAYVCRAGANMYQREEDYVGLGALDPANPEIVYLSTTFDPRDDRRLGVHEIWKGVTPDRGATWKWTPVTENSTRDNLRPIVPAWDKTHTALLWWRGSSWASQHYDAAVVGIIDSVEEKADAKSYVDAAADNTVQAGGRPLAASGPDPKAGPNDDRWHWRSGFGNGGSVLTAAETGGELAPKLKTSVKVERPGVYDVWVCFWANPDEDWRIRAGLAPDGLSLYRSMASQTVSAADFIVPPVIVGAGNTYLYQAYLGRVTVAATFAFEVFIANDPTRTGTENERGGGRERTWYDGVSFARVTK